METITNAANAASKAIWGENNNASAETGQEPLAGEQGRGTADSPYDRGNAEGQSGSAGPDAGSSNPGPTSGSTGTGLQPGIPSSGSQSQGTNIAGQIRPEHQQDKTGVTGLHSDDPKFSDQRPSDSNAASTSDRGQKAPAGGIGAAEPSVGASPSSGQQPTQKQQGGDRPTEEPSSGSQSKSEQEKQALFEKATGQKEDHSGDPLGKHSGSKPSGGEQEEGPGGKSTGEGTGEKYVKSTGLASQGGDFDATKPGAGKEADRLLEEQGVHHGAGAAKPEAADTGAHETGEGNGNGKKHGMGEKIKHKLHIGKH